MTSVLQPEQIAFFLVFVVPGFVALKVYRLLIAGERIEGGTILVEAISYSFINLALTFWIPLLIWRDHYISDEPVRFVLSGALVLLVSPAALAVAIWRFRTSAWALRWVIIKEGYQAAYTPRNPLPPQGGSSTLPRPSSSAQDKK